MKLTAHDDDQQHGTHGAEGQQDFAGQITEDDQTRHSRVVRLRRPNKQTHRPARNAEPSKKDAALSCDWGRLSLRTLIHRCNPLQIVQPRGRSQLVPTPRRVCCCAGQGARSVVWSFQISFEQRSPAHRRPGPSGCALKPASLRCRPWKGNNHSQRPAPCLAGFKATTRCEN